MSDHIYTTLKKISQIELSDNARKIFEKRYAAKDDLGKPFETVEDAFHRV